MQKSPMIQKNKVSCKGLSFLRETGFTTAYIGSSNLSSAALTSGLEWNPKVTEKDSFGIIKKFEATFESYWNDAEFIALKESVRKIRKG
jgi:HKD family nuclease